MPVFNFPQYEHEPFWSCLSRLNDYRAHQLNQKLQKWKICEIIAVSLNSESRGYVESIYLGGVLGLLSKTQDEFWDSFEKLAWDTYAFEQANENFRYPTHGEYDFHANPFPQDPFIDSYYPSYPYLPPGFHYYCDFCDHDVYTCPYRNYIDATCTRVEKTINELTDKMAKNMKKRMVEYFHCFNQSRENCNES